MGQPTHNRYGGIMVRITNHLQRAISLLAAQFQETKRDNSPTNFQKLLAALIASAQEIEDANWQLYSQRSLDTAQGVQLGGYVDFNGVSTEVGLGSILGVPRRDGESDEDYRERLRFQSFINTAKGTPEEIITTIKTLTKASYVAYNEIYPAAFQLYTNGLSFPNPPCQIVEAIHNVSPAGVQYAPVTATLGVPIPFIFGSDPVNSLLVVSHNSSLPNLQVTNGVDNFLLSVNANRIPITATEGYFAEALADNTLLTQGAGQLAEVFYLNSNLPPPG